MNEILTQEKSIYLQISEMIENDILRDIILEEEKVPSTNELAKLYAINPATAAKGINILVDQEKRDWHVCGGGRKEYHSEKAPGGILQ